MPYFAKVDENHIVLQVIVAEPGFIESGSLGDHTEWIECSKDGSIRGIYPGIGDHYDLVTDEFRKPKPVQFPSWIWAVDPKTNTKTWMPPVPHIWNAKNPRDVVWDEATVQWIDQPNPNRIRIPPKLWDEEKQEFVDNPDYLK